MDMIGDYEDLEEMIDEILDDFRWCGLEISRQSMLIEIPDWQAYKEKKGYD